MENMEGDKYTNGMSDILNENESLTPLLTEKETSSKKSKVLGGLLAFLSSLLFTAIGVIVQQRGHIVDSRMYIWSTPDVII